MKTNIWQINAWCTGIKKRDRKTKRHMFEITEIPDNGSKPDIDPLWSIDAINQAKETMKEFKNLKLQLRPMVKENGMESFLMFDPREIIIEVEL